MQYKRGETCCLEWNLTYGTLYSYMYMKNDKINEKTRNKDKYGSIKIHDVENTTVINTDRIKNK